MKQNTRRIILQNAHNVRDVGGYTAENGKVVCWGKLFRSDSLIHLNDNDLKTLEKYNIKTIIDLRSKTEALAAPDKLPLGAEYCHRPIQRLEVNLDGSAVTEFEHSLSESYEKVLTNTCDLLVEALKALIDGLSNGAVLYHCTAGKDRTGIVTATILQLLGVCQEDIIADYQVSATYNKNGINKQLMSLPNFEELKPILTSDPSNLDFLLEFFNSTSLEEHLIKNGLEEDYIAILRKIMLV